MTEGYVVTNSLSNWDPIWDPSNKQAYKENISLGGGFVSTTISDNNSSPHDDSTYPEEDEEEEQEPLVELLNPVFIEPYEELRIMQPATLEVTVKYLTERKPKDIQFRVQGIYDNESVESIYQIGTINNEGNARVEIEIPEHIQYFYKENKEEADRVTYAFTASCIQDGTQVTSDPVQLPHSNINIDVLEFPTSIFEGNSSIPFLDKDGILVNFIASSILYTEANPKKKMMRVVAPEPASTPETELQESR